MAIAIFFVGPGLSSRRLSILILTAWSLVLRHSHVLIQDCQGFVLDISVTHANNARKKSVHESRLVLAMDPYEYQYQQYFNGHDGTSNVDNMSSNAHQPQKRTPAIADTYGYHGQRPMEEQTTVNSNIITMDPYELQYQQYSRSTSHPDYNGGRPMEQQTTVNSNAIPMDPYERQYQQYSRSTSHPDTALPTGSTNTHSNTANNNGIIDLSKTQPVTADQNLNVEKDLLSTLPVAMNEDKHVENNKITIASRGQEVTPEHEPNLGELEDRFLKMVSTEVQVKKLVGQNPYALTDIQLGVIIERWLDTLEDSTQKNNGKFKGQSKLKGKDMPRTDRKTVIVLGTGWAAHAFIKLASTYDLRIVVVSPVNHFVFTPMLASAAVGTIEYRSMTEPIRVTNPFIDNYVEGGAIGIDVPNKQLTVQLTSLSTVTGAFKGIAANAPCRLEPEPIIADNAETTSGAGRLVQLSYDYLVCAVGTASRSSMVPGAKDHCFNLKTSQDSKRLRTAIGEALEYASRPDVQVNYYPSVEKQELATQERQQRVRFVLVGGGPTGVELAGELSDFFAQVCRSPDGAFQHLAKDISIILVHGGSELLPAMDQDLRQRALEALQAQGVEIRLNTRLKEVGRDFVRLAEKGSDEEETIRVGLTVWAAGNTPVPFVKELLSQLPECAAGSAGRVNVDRWLRCPTPTPETFGSILVLGDVACLEAKSKYDPAPTSLPQTAQVAGQQGAFAARMLNRGYDLQRTPPRLPENDELSLSDELSLLRVWLQLRGLQEAPEFTFLSLGLLAYVGGEEALNQVQLGDVPIFNYYGKVAFALWRSVYLAKQASSRNQALITFDWLRTEVFGRDITRL